MSSRLRIGRAAMSIAALLAISLPAWADDVTLENVRIGVGEISYEAPRVVVRGTSLSRQDLHRILDATTAEPLLDRVGRLNADTIEVPEIIADIAAPQGRQRTRYLDVRFTGVKAGRVASMTSASGASERTGKNTAEVAFGRAEVKDFDLPYSVSLFSTEPPNGASASLRPVYGAFSIADMTMSDGKTPPIRIGRITGRDFRAKPTSLGWLGTVKAFSDTPDLKAATPEARRRSLDALSDLFDSFSLGTVEATDIGFGSREAGADGGTVARVTFSGGDGPAGSDIRVDGIDVNVAGGRFKLASLGYGGLSMRPVIEMMRETDGWITGAPDPAAARRLVGLLRSFRVEGLEMQGAPERGPPTGGDKQGDGTGNQPAATAPWSARLAGLSFGSEKPVEGIPTEIRLDLRSLAFTVPANPKDSFLQQLAALGYRNVDTSASLNLGWNEAGQEIVLREFMVDGADMGRAGIRAVVGGLSRDIFNPDTAVASVAFVGASAKSAEIAVENRGLFERLLARESQRQKRPAEDIRREYGMAAAVGIPAILGGSPAAKTLAQAVARFVAKPGRLILTAKSKQAGGYGVADFAASPNPASVLEAIDITATAD